MAISSPSDDTATASVTPLVSFDEVVEHPVELAGILGDAHRPSSVSWSLLPESRPGPARVPACRPERALGRGPAWVDRPHRRRRWCRCRWSHRGPRSRRCGATLAPRDPLRVAAGRRGRPRPRSAGGRPGPAAGARPPAASVILDDRPGGIGHARRRAARSPCSTTSSCSSGRSGSGRWHSPDGSSATSWPRSRSGQRCGQCRSRR